MKYVVGGHWHSDLAAAWDAYIPFEGSWIPVSAGILVSCMQQVMAQVTGTLLPTSED